MDSHFGLKAQWLIPPSKRTHHTQADVWDLQESTTLGEADVWVVKDIDRIADQAKALTDVKGFRQFQEQNENKFFSHVAKLPEVKKSETYTIMFIGRTSAGKTSLQNKLFGLNEKTAPIPNTTGAQVVMQTDEYAIIDVFGMNDKETYLTAAKCLQMKAQHTIGVVYTDAVENSLNLFRLLHALKVRTVAIRNKSETLTPEDIDTVRNHDLKQLEPFGVTELHVVSATTGLGVVGLKQALLGDHPSAARARL